MIAFTIPGLDYISKAFAYALWAFNEVTGNFGLAIILLTIAMRIVILPLTIKQTKSMIAMQKLQPQLKEIQKKYKDDREKMGQEMMKLYKENKVSPLGGCLPLLVQLPVIFAVFEVLRNTKKFSSILGPVNYQFLGMDVTKQGSAVWKAGGYAQFIILIILTVITGYISAKMMTTDPKQSKIMALMPVLFGVFAWILPIGVSIYIIVTNIFTMVQQYIQLERDGFYDEREEQRLKTGEPLKSYEKLKFKSRSYTASALVATRIKRKPAPPAKKGPAGKKAKAPAGKPSDAKAGEETGGGKKAAGGKGPAAKKADKDTKTATTKEKTEDVKPTPEGEKSVQEIAKSQPKSYPAKKQSKGKKK